MTATTTDALTLVLAELGHVQQQQPLLRTLLDTHQAGIGFLTVEAAKVQDDLLRTERHDRLAHARDGLTVPGHAPAPVSVSPLSLMGEWRDLLLDTHRFLSEHAARAGIVDAFASDDATTDDELADALTTRLVVLGFKRTSYLNRLHRDLVSLGDRGARCIDGTQIKAMPDPCPWCGLNTLVADLTNGVITCGTDAATGIRQWCICSDSYCPCHTNHRHRHTWVRDHKPHKTTSWQGLRRAINTQESR